MPRMVQIFCRALPELNIKPRLQVIVNNRRVFQRVAEAFVDLAQSLVPGHQFALRANAGGAHKVSSRFSRLVNEKHQQWQSSQTL